MTRKDLNGFRLFKKAFIATHREIVASLSILLMATIVFTMVMWIAEHRTNPDYSLWDALVWIIVKYVDDPADVAIAPVTLLGQIGCDSNGKLNHKSVILEGDLEHSSGAQIPVDLSELKEYSLFPGQVRSEASPLWVRLCSLLLVCVVDCGQVPRTFNL